MAKGWLGIVDRTVNPGLASPAEISEHPFAFMCPKPGCYLARSADSREHAELIQSQHTCPHVGGITHIGSTVTLTLLETCWEKADRTYERLVTSDSLSNDERERIKGQLNGMCQVIAVFMPPLMTTAKEVGEEIQKRYTMKQAGEPYETPGLGSRRYETALSSAPRKATVAERAAKVLTEKEQAAIKLAFESGLFSVTELAKTYDVTEAVVREVTQSNS